MSKQPKAKKAIMLGLDGADPVLLKKFFDEGYLPNLQKVVKIGTTTKDMSMLGAMPTITPPNWASLSTGAWPGTHGITCFWNHTLGKSLTELEHGFNSKLSEAEFIWDVAAREGKKSIVFNYPTGWPASNPNVIAIDGSGINVNSKGFVDFETLYYCKEDGSAIQVNFHDGDQSGNNCMVEGEVDTKEFEVEETVEEKSERLAKGIPGSKGVTIGDEKRVNPEEGGADVVYTPIKACKNWKKDVGTAKEVVLPVNTAQQSRYGLLIAEDGKTYNKLEIYASKQAEEPLGAVAAGEWSEWIYDTFKVSSQDVKVAYKIKVMKMEADGSDMELYYSFALDLNSSKWFHPHEIGPTLYAEVGPMVHMSNCGRDEICIETHEAMYDWDARAMEYLTRTTDWSIMYIHVHALDICNHFYQSKILEEHGLDYNYYMYDVVLKYYQMSDKLVGEMLNMMDEETTMFICSDHGGMSREFGCDTPLIGDPWGVGGKLLEEMGYLVINRESGKAEIDWEKTRAIGQRSGYIYINLKGRDPQGSVDPEDYDALVQEIIDKIITYRDKTGRRPFNLAFNRQDMEVFGLHGEHVGDIYFTFYPNWARVHGTSLTTNSYKNTSVKCLFMAVGAGIKQECILDRSVRIVDVVPTICELLDMDVPNKTEGGVIYQALEK